MLLPGARSAAVERRLAAILAADVVGYSRLMGRDEVGTLGRLKHLRREVAEPAIARHKGRLVKLTGDGLLVELPSVVEAVACALEIQAGVALAQAEIAPDARILLRIGVHLGDVIVEPGDIYGDGVNLAARLEQAAEPGSICVSEPVRQNVEGKLEAVFEDLGERRLKNIERPVRLHRVRPAATGPPPRTPRGQSVWRRLGTRPALAIGLALALLGLTVAAGWLLRPYPPGRPSVDELALGRPGGLPLPAEPSLAVLPLANFSGDPAQDYFGDGLTETLITTLSRVPRLFVIARNSAFTYKGRAVDVREVGRELGVRWVLEGSVQKAGDRVRVNAQLIDTTTGFHLWAERFDRRLDDLFELQDAIAGEVLAALQIRLGEEERRALARRYTPDLAAWDLYLQGRAAFWRGSREGREEAQRLFDAAIERDPRFALAYAARALTLSGHAIEATAEPAEASARALELANRAAALDPTIPQVHVLLGMVQMYTGRHDEARASAERVIALDPGSADGWALLGFVELVTGDPAASLERMARALRLNPAGGAIYLIAVAQAQLLLGQPGNAISTLERVLELNPDYDRARILAVAAYAHAGRLDEARWAADEVAIRLPGLRRADVLRTFPFRDQRHRDVLLAGLERAGLVLVD